MPTFPYTITEVIDWAAICSGLQQVAKSKEKHLKGGTTQKYNPRLLYIARMAAEYKGSDTSDAIKRYIIALCGSNFLFKAQNATGGGSSITPSLPVSSPYLIPITGADFANSTDYLNVSIAGKNLEIWWSGANRYLYEPSSPLGAEFAYISGGVQITIAGFDAAGLNMTDQFKIYILNN